MKLSRLLIFGISVLISACGGGTTTPVSDTTTSTTIPTPPSTPPTPPPTTPPTLQQKPGVLATNLGLSKRLLLGLGTTNVSDIQTQNIHVDIYDQYLTGVGNGAWPTWNNPSGAYVQVVAKNATSLGAVPMFTLYQMAANGDGNLSGLTNPTFMSAYWSNVRLLFQQIKIFGKPVLVNFEPDFWEYAQRASTNADPTSVTALVNSNTDCANLPNNVAGVAQCLLLTARTYAPNAYVGFPPSLASDLYPASVGFMQKLGTAKADFVVMQTLDRDAGCFEAIPQPSYCSRPGTAWYWDETNTNTPNFAQNIAQGSNFNTSLQLPLLWWQTPLGAPSTTPGGSSGQWRDNRVHYFLNHAADLVAAGAIGVVFSAGEVHQTTINTDGGQFKKLSGIYYTSPAALP
ncbi:hypothetical protein [Undibacterium jejuense]|uniref:hypothetical protein n=1 Tax=Undibacterium jejuense TaxID=1344949 RepID=UPI001FEC1122|nr:hypothetical protein [Undibacterium jejuense]